MNCIKACTTIYNVSNMALFNGIKKKKNIKQTKLHHIEKSTLDNFY